MVVLQSLSQEHEGHYDFINDHKCLSANSFNCNLLVELKDPQARLIHQTWHTRCFLKPLNLSHISIKGP